MTWWRQGHPESRQVGHPWRATTDYHFVSHWRVAGTIEEVHAILSDAPGLARWWPAVYLDVRELHLGAERGLGREVALHTKGWLPYTLRWWFRITEVRPDGFSLVAGGDFAGQGTWTFRQDGRWVDLTYDWHIRADKPLLRYGSFLLKPLFAWNHRWAMARGEESLTLELARRHAATPQERARIPAPPGPATLATPLLAGTVALAGLTLLGALRGRKGAGKHQSAGQASALSSRRDRAVT